jgi:hypothetical protein
MSFLGPDRRVTMATLDCISTLGIENVNVDVVAKQLTRSRATLYQRFGSWRGLLQHAHGQVLDLLDSYLDVWQLERRPGFEKWWSEVSIVLRHPDGCAFRALRGRVAGDGGCEELALEEVRRLPLLRYWIERGLENGVPAVAYKVWMLLLATAAYEPGTKEADDLRELAWSMVGSVDRPLSEMPLFRR